MGANYTERVVVYCAEECEFQRSGGLSVYWMLQAWQFAHRRQKRSFTVQDILTLGIAIEPEKNNRGTRLPHQWVRVGNDLKMDPVFVADALKTLVAQQPKIGCSDKAAREWFHEYEDIHPFIDGNGRSGSLLHNWLRGSLSEPIHFPNIWKERQRSYSGYPVPQLRP